MRECDLCGNENPDEARFCMKCARDLDPVSGTDISPEKVDTGAFIPAADDEYARLAPTRGNISRADPADIEMYKKAASESAASIEQEAVWQEQFVDEPSEIRQTDVTADFVVKSKSCNRCGAANPHEQKYCKQCGAAFDGALPSMADATFQAAAPVPIATGPVETSYLADVSSSRYGEPPPTNQAVRRERERGGGSGTLADWGVRQWLIIIVLVLIVAAVAWFFFFGGKNALFDSQAGVIKKAGKAMENLGSFEMNVNLTFESVQSGRSEGTGKVIFEKPARNYWENNFGVAGASYLVGLIQIDNKVYQTGGNGWQAADPGNTTGNILGFWNDVSAVEDLGSTNFGGVPCYHYRYRVPSRYVTSPLGVSNQESVSDARVEVWIENATSKVLRMTAEVYGVEFAAQNFKAGMDMSLGATGQPYNINAPL